MIKFGIRDDVNFQILNTATNEKVLDIDISINDKTSISEAIQCKFKNKLIPMTIEANGDLKFTTYIDEETYSKLMEYKKNRE